MTTSADLASVLRDYLGSRGSGSSELPIEGAPEEERRELEELVELVTDIENVFDLLRRPEEPMPERVGRYQPIRVLGRGGFSAVYQAWDPDLRRLVALKLLSRHSERVKDRRRWMTTEGSSIARLEHEGVIRVYDVGEEEQWAYLAMEYVSGPSLREVLRAMKGEGDEASPALADAVRHLTPLAERCRLVARIARALAACHDQGILHRDVKPDNVLLDGPERPRLIDFGLAHLGGGPAGAHVTEEFVGTLPYLAPEQVDGKRTGADPKTDQFALGVLLYEAITLAHPFQGSSLSRTVDSVSQARPPSPRSVDPSLPADLERICLHALERRPQDRYASVADLASDLEAFLDHRAISLAPPSPLQAARRWLWRNRRAVAVAAAAAAAALALGLVRERAERRDFVAELEARRATLDELATANELHELISWLQARQAQADRKEVSELLPWPRAELERFWRDLAPRIDARVADLRAAERDRLDHGEPPHERLAALASEWGPVRSHLRWSSPIDLPDPPRLVLDPGARLERFEGADCEPLYAPVPWAAVREATPGWYRMTRNGGEVEFFVREDDLDFRPRIAPTPAWMDALLTTVPETDLGRTSDCDRVVSAFELSAEPVRWRDFGPVLTDAERAGLREARVGLDTSEGAVVAVPWSYAQAFCARTGVRLPTLSELRAAALHGVLDDDDAFWLGHWTSPSTTDEDDVTIFPSWAKAPETRDPGKWMLELKADGFPENVCLRVARSLPRE